MIGKRKLLYPPSDFSDGSNITPPELSPMKVIRHFLLSCGVLVVTTVGVTREPTSLEQYYLELVNRARANPNGEVARLSDEPLEIWGDEGSPVPADLNEGIAPGTISAAAKQPLAFDTRLIDSASDYSDLLLATEQFTHTANGSSHSRMIAAGYLFTPPSRSGENLATTASTGPHLVDQARVDQHHAGLFIDGDVAGRGHRINLMQGDFREVGMAIRADEDGLSIFGASFNEVLSTQNFATSSGRIFLTGVIYHDTNSNSFYNPGESAGILSLAVKTTGGTTVTSGTSFASGGYSINMNGIAAGNYVLSVRDAFNIEETRPFVWGSTQNVKLDLVDPSFAGPPVLGIPFRPDGRIGTTPSSFTGNDLYDPTGSQQQITLTAKSAKSLSWHVRFENDGSENDTLRLAGTSGTPFFSLTYLRRGGGSTTNVTAAIRTGLGESLQNGAEVSYEIVASPQKRALGKRTGLILSLEATSDGDGTKVDTVKGSLVNRTKKAKKPRR